MYFLLITIFNTYHNTIDKYFQLDFHKKMTEACSVILRCRVIYKVTNQNLRLSSIDVRTF